MLINVTYVGFFPSIYDCINLVPGLLRFILNGKYAILSNGVIGK